MVVEKRQLELQQPDESQALVRMVLCPINPSDLIPISGAYSHRITLPMVCGYEGMGIVERTGKEVLGLRVGDRVLVTKCRGTWSERIVADHSQLVKVPEDIPDSVAARGYINPVTCALLLAKHPVKDSRLLITGAGTSCSMLLSQMALFQGAASVVVVHRTTASRSLYKELGVRQISGDQSKDIESEARLSDLVLDCVGGDLAHTILASQKPTAEFVSYGLMSGHPIDERQFPSRIQKFFLRLEQEKLSPKEWHPLFDTIWPLLSLHKLQDIQAFPVEDFKEALQYYYSEPRAFKPALKF